MRGLSIYISHLSLLNYRNYETLELELKPGMVLVHGRNGQGKSNLLEAMYLLAIAKSPRATTDRDLVRLHTTHGDPLGQVAAVIQTDAGSTRVQVDFRSTSPSLDVGEPESHGVSDRPGNQRPTAGSVHKSVRVNGVPRRASDLVGEVNAVMFNAEDLDLVLGPPSERRRYLDVLISQLDRHYLRALQRYQRVLTQRNHLLRAVKEGRSQYGELDFWNDEMSSLGGQVMFRRAQAVAALSLKAGPIHQRLIGDSEELMIVYLPSVESGSSTAEDDFCRALKAAMELARDREVAQGFTVVGPHRDDIQMFLAGEDAGVYASRGQCRTVALAMRLAEAAYLSEQRGHEPIILLDDVLSELDSDRRLQVLEQAGLYQQCFITTADVETIDGCFLQRMARFEVRSGTVEAVDISLPLEASDSPLP